ncbi:hypothetical protein ATKI12_2359 [Kitasatospora sp. Ki12]
MGTTPATVITIPLATDGAEWAIGHSGGSHRLERVKRPVAAPPPETRKGRADHPQG